MKPIGSHVNHADGDPVLGASPGETSDPVRPRARIQSYQTARLEDIIGVAPVASTGSAADVLFDALRAALTADTRQRQLSQLAIVFAEHAAADFVGLAAAGGQRIGEAAAISTLTGSLPEERASHVESACRAAGSAAAAVEHSCEDGWLAAIQLGVHSGECLVLSAAQRPPARILAGLEYASSVLAERSGRLQQQQAQHAAVNAAALVELLSLVTAEKTEQAAQQRLVAELQRHLRSERVYLGTRHDGQPTCQVRAISEVPEIDRHAQRTQQIEAVLQESVARANASLWPTEEQENRHALLAHEQLARAAGFAAVIATPLRCETGDIVGSLVVGFADPTAAAQQLAFVHAASRAVGTTVDALRRSHQSTAGRWLAGIKKRLRGNIGMSVLVVVTLLAALLAVPVDYRVRGEAELQPLSRRYIAAPFDASLQECLVEPGDVVKADQVLATLDGREVQWELAGLRADMKKAEKEHSAHLSRQAFGEAAMARHEVERLRNRTRLLSDREQNLAIRSPVDGVVVTGDLREREGVPLEMGQSLFEIAPLDTLIIEVGIPEEDVRHVREGMTIRLKLHAVPADPVDAVIRRIHPRAELRDHDNVFIAEAVIDNTDLRLRPGMKGAALVSTGPRPLGWNLLHKPFAHAAGWLGW